MSPPALIGSQNDSLVRMLIAATADGVVGIDARGVVQICNSSCAQMFGYSPSEVTGQNINVLTPSAAPMERDGFPSSCRKASAKQIAGIGREVMGRRKDRTNFPVRLIVGKGELDRHQISIGVIRDPADQKTATEAARQTEARMHSILDIVPEAIIVIDEMGTIETFSPAASQLFGCASADVIGKNVKILMPPPYRGQHDSHLSQYRVTGEKRIIGKGRIVVGRHCDGSTFSMELTVGEIVDGGRRLFVGFMRDISECQRDLKEAQTELLHASRLSAMGQMTAAVAHELNQPLTAIANYMTAIRRTLALNEDLPALIMRAQDMIGEAAQQTLRAGEIIRNLRDFVEKRESHRTTQNLNRVVEEAIALGFIGAGDNNIKMHLDLDPALPLVVIAKVQIQQVLINLIRNSMEAMMGMKKRDLTISTGLDTPGFVQVTVADTGPGLPPEISKRLFEPFVTTKDKGMGIGLTICRSIIDDHGGKISILPNRTVGTAFHIRLPIARHAELGDAA